VLRRRTPPRKPIAQKIHPIGLSGWREAMTAPIVEKVKTGTTASTGEKATDTMTLWSHWSTITS
jgi:hypothetical protein